MTICQDGKLITGWDIIQIRRWYRVALSFDGLTFLNVKGDVQIYFPDQNFKNLYISPKLIFIFYPLSILSFKDNF